MATRFLTRQQVAEKLNISMAQCYALIRRGELRAAKIGAVVTTGSAGMTSRRTSSGHIRRPRGGSRSTRSPTNTSTMPEAFASAAEFIGESIQADSSWSGDRR